LNVKPQTIIECIAYNMKQEKEVFRLRFIESNANRALLKKGTSNLTLDKGADVMKNATTGLKVYTKARFFLRK
jgi:hypothetical protein